MTPEEMKGYAALGFIAALIIGMVGYWIITDF